MWPRFFGGIVTLDLLRRRSASPGGDRGRAAAGHHRAASSTSSSVSAPRQRRDHSLRRGEGGNSALRTRFAFEIVARRARRPGHHRPRQDRALRTCATATRRESQTITATIPAAAHHDAGRRIASACLSDPLAHRLVAGAELLIDGEDRGPTAASLPRPGVDRRNMLVDATAGQGPARGPTTQRRSRRAAYRSWPDFARLKKQFGVIAPRSRPMPHASSSACATVKPRRQTRAPSTPPQRVRSVRLRERATRATQPRRSRIARSARRSGAPRTARSGAQTPSVAPGAPPFIFPGIVGPRPTPSSASTACGTSTAQAARSPRPDVSSQTRVTGRRAQVQLAKQHKVDVTAQGAPRADQARDGGLCSTTQARPTRAQADVQASATSLLQSRSRRSPHHHSPPRLLQRHQHHHLAQATSPRPPCPHTSPAVKQTSSVPAAGGTPSPPSSPGTEDGVRARPAPPQPEPRRRRRRRPAAGSSGASSSDRSGADEWPQASAAAGSRSSSAPGHQPSSIEVGEKKRARAHAAHRFLRRRAYRAPPRGTPRAGAQQ